MYNTQLNNLIEKIANTVNSIRILPFDSAVKLGDETAKEMVEYISSLQNYSILRIWPTEELEKYLLLPANKRLEFWKGNSIYYIVNNSKQKFYNELDPAILKKFNDLYEDKINSSTNSNKAIVLGIIGIGIFLLIKK